MAGTRRRAPHRTRTPTGTARRRAPGSRRCDRREHVAARVPNCRAHRHRARLDDTGARRTPRRNRRRSVGGIDARRHRRAMARVSRFDARSRGLRAVTLRRRTGARILRRPCSAPSGCDAARHQPQRRHSHPPSTPRSGRQASAQSRRLLVRRLRCGCPLRRFVRVAAHDDGGRNRVAVSRLAVCRVVMCSCTDARSR